MLGYMRYLRHVLAVVGVAALLAACSSSAKAPSPTVSDQMSTAATASVPKPSISLSLPSGGPSSASAAATTSAIAVATDVRKVTELAAGFATPSGRIVCIMEDSSVRCDFIATDKAWTSPEPKGCQLAWGDSLELTTTAGSTCHGDTLADTPALDSDVVGWRRSGDPVAVVNGLSLAALPYGSSLLVGTLQCDSASTGITCKNTSTGHGFTMSREAYSIF